MGVFNCSMFCCTLLYVHSSFAIDGREREREREREMVALHSLSSWCLVIVVWLFLVVTWVCLQFVIVVFPDHTHLLFINEFLFSKSENLPNHILLFSFDLDSNLFGNIIVILHM